MPTIVGRAHRFWIGPLLVLSLALSMSGLLSSAWGCPSIPLMSYSESVPETTEVGTIILTVLASANPGETLTFLIIDNPSEERSFEIDATGNLTLSRTLDYETRSSDYVFDVFASISGSCSRSVGVTISIINENDNAPHCAQQVLYSSVQENSTLPVDNVVALSCTDGDEMGLTYQFTSGNENGIFSIDSDGKVSTIEVLDYESQSSFELNVLVLDRGFALQYNTTVKIFVSVEPVNEFSPEFANTTFEFYVYESASLGSIVGQASAVDQDSRADGTIFYSLPPGGDSEVFTICSENGYVYLRRSLDFEVTTSYEFEVIASDSSLLEGNRLTSTATILVHVRDSNDHTPAFTQSIYYVQVPEEDETETGSNITQLTCADSDSGSNQELTYTIISGNEQGQFGISSSGQITFESTSLLDFDQGTRLFELTVKCMDAGLPRRSAEVLVVLEVTGVNDFEPNPSSTEYVLNVAEDTPPGTSIGQVQANDQDMGLAGVLSYSIASCPSGLLHIDPVDGTVYLMGTLDYEAGLTEITCVASVRDSQQPIKAREVDLIIAIVDINDEPPTCDAPIKLFSIGEDSLPGYIITFFCEDVDSSTLQYSIPSGGPFNVNPNGNMIILTLQSQLDYETQSAYSFPIEVSDGDFTTVVGVYISVVDTNEHAPTFSSEHFQCNISESAQVGTLVCETIASDTDAGTLRYRVINSTENGTFVIDPVTGAIMLSASLDYEKDTEYTLIVEVSDSGSPVRSSLAVVQITVRDENDHAPLMKPLYFTAVSENATLGASLAFLDCQDVDSGNNGIMALEIASTSAVLSNGEEFTVADNTFVIDSTSGHLNLNELLDYETFQLYTVQVVCKDHGLPSLSAVSTVTIEVLPVNEFVPSFELQRYTVSIPESSSMGTSILQVKASDNDFSEDGTIAFSLNSTQYLYINPETGIVTVVKPIDCARGTVYDYSVEARDGGSPMLSAEVELEVHIINCSLGSLVPDSTFHTANVSESAPVGTVVFSVSCTGSRESLIGDGYSSHYAMTPTDSSPFEVDTLTGEVSVSFPLDYETSTSYLLLLQCYDPSGSLDAASSISAYITILPENEHPPKFSVGLYTVQVHEDVSLSSSILSIQAYDMDGGEDGSITYSIQQAEQTFSIDPISGKIYLTDFLDFETTEQIDFQVFAEDNPRETGSKRYSHVNVTVKVLDSNDHRPECERTFYHATTSQLTTVGTRLVNVNCSDKDQGQNAELEYRISDDTVLEFFAVNSTTGELTLLQTLNPDIAVVHLVPIAVLDKGNSSLTSTVVVIVDVQDPLNLIEEDEGSEVDNEDAASQTELEGRGNSVKMVLKDLSLQLWEQEAEEYFREAIAHSVTHYCALLPEACSLVSGCSEFYGSRKKRNLVDNYASFMQPNINLLEPPNEIQAEDLTSLEVQFYVSLPAQATKAPLRETDYVIPRGTLNEIVQQEGPVVEAVVRDSVAPSLTQTDSEETETESSWNPITTAAVIVTAVLVSVVGIGLICTAVYKYKKRNTSKNQVFPIHIPPPTVTRVHERTTTSTNGSTTGGNTSRGSVPSCFTAGHSDSSSPNTKQLLDAEEASMEPNSRSSMTSTELDSRSSIRTTGGEVGRLRGHASPAGMLADEYMQNWPFTPPGLLEPMVRQGHARVQGSWGASMHNREFRISSRNKH